MEPEEAHRMVEEAAELLAESLKAGKSDTLKAYLKAMARFYNYSIGNVILIMLQRPDASRVAGYGTWKALGRQVKLGSKGISIVAPVVVRGRSSRDDEQEDKTRVVAFRGATVFDVSQTDGSSRPLAEFSKASGDPGEHLERLHRFITSQGIVIEYSERLGGAEGASCGKKILVKQGLPPAETFSVLCHELGHELLGHHDKERPSRAALETEAEALAYVVCQSVHIESKQAATDYIHLYNDGDVERLRASLERIRKTASTIIRAILEDPKVPARTDIEAVRQETMAAA
jgi:antirestriction protein ArdC